MRAGIPVQATPLRRPTVLAMVGGACIGLALASCGISPGPLSNRSVSPTIDGSAGAAPSDAENATSASPHAATLYVPEDSTDPVGRSLAVIVDGQTVYLRNGGRVILGDGLAVEIFANPYPQSLLGSTLDFYLTRADSAVTGAGIGIDYDMLGMSHGPFSADATEIGAGDYLVSPYYIGSGLWQLDIAISIGLQRIRINVVVAVV